MRAKISQYNSQFNDCYCCRFALETATNKYNFDQANFEISKNSKHKTSSTKSKLSGTS